MTEMTLEKYQKIMEIVTSGLDWKEIGLYVVKNHPDVFLEAFGGGAWRESIRDVYKNKDKIAAIKYVREKANLGLREAKEVVEDVCSDLEIARRSAYTMEME